MGTRDRESKGKYFFGYGDRCIGVPITGLCLVAAHSWDIADTFKAGGSAAFVARFGMVLDPFATPPIFVGTNLAEIADLAVSIPSSR